jgi:hypothetical protein
LKERAALNGRGSEQPLKERAALNGRGSEQPLKERAALNGRGSLYHLSWTRSKKLILKSFQPPVLFDLVIVIFVVGVNVGCFCLVVTLLSRCVSPTAALRKLVPTIIENMREKRLKVL